MIIGQIFNAFVYKWHIVTFIIDILMIYTGYWWKSKWVPAFTNKTKSADYKHWLKWRGKNISLDLQWMWKCEWHLFWSLQLLCGGNQYSYCFVHYNSGTNIIILFCHDITEIQSNLSMCSCTSYRHCLAVSWINRTPFSFPVIEKVTWIGHLLRGHLS